MINKDSGNVLSDVPASLPEELEQLLFSGKQLSIKRILSRGQRSSQNFWYDQADNEWVLVLQGEGILEFVNEDTVETRHMKQGDYCFIPAHQKHRIQWTAEDQTTIWLAIHFPAQEAG